MCCSDCAPINFIVAKNPVSLRIEKDTFCIGKDQTPVLFEITPEDGKIKIVQQDIKGLTISGNKLVIDEANFPQEQFGKKITFTVNDQITEAEITFYKIPEFDFDVPDSPITNPNITFIANGSDLISGVKYYWDFGDGKYSNERNPTHQYTLPVNEKNTITVSLTVIASNGVCQNTVSHEIEFKKIEKENCIEEVFAAILKDRESFDPNNMDLNDILREKIVFPTIELYENVLSDTESFLIGEKNRDLQDLFIKLIKITVNELQSRSLDNYSFEQISRLFILQLKLFYNILLCQSKEKLQNDNNIISGILNIIYELLYKLNKNEINFDLDGEMRDYLNIYFEIINTRYVKIIIKKHLNLLPPWS
jgi:PKD repeat protein